MFTIKHTVSAFPQEEENMTCEIFSPVLTRRYLRIETLHPFIELLRETPSRLLARVNGVVCPGRRHNLGGPVRQCARLEQIPQALNVMYIGLRASSLS
jgi:hypothetical protein